MSLTKKEWEEVFERLKRIERVNHKLWRAKHYRWANAINWEVQQLKNKVQQVISQLE